MPGITNSSFRRPAPRIHGSNRTTRTRKTVRSLRVAVPKVPALIQAPIDRLIEKGKQEGLTRSERHALDEALDYLDQLSLIALERIPAPAKKRR